MGLNNRVQMYRWKKKWSEEQLSRAAGVSRSVICKLENGANVNPTAEVAFRLADALITKEESRIMVDEAEKCRREIIREVRSIENLWILKQIWMVIKNIQN